MTATRQKPGKRKLKPRTPSRIKKRTGKKIRSHHHPELWGLGMLAVGLFLATLVWFGWDGGAVGATLADGLHGAFGVAAYLIPVALVCIGGLMLVRSSIVDLKPFRTGLAVGAFGLMIALGRDEGGTIGGGLGGGLAHVLGETGALIVGVALLIAGTLLFTGASAGALLRRSGAAVRLAGSAARRTFDVRESFARDPESDEAPPFEPRRAPVDVVAQYPDVVAPTVETAESPRLALHHGESAHEAPTGEDVGELSFESVPSGEYRLPDRDLLRPSPAVTGDNGAASARIAVA